MTSHPFPSQPRLALLIDGENLSCALAAQLEAAVAQHGRSPIARVYGDAQLLTGWERRGG